MTDNVTTLSNMTNLENTVKHSTPILSAVKRMHADDDARQAASHGYNPYHHGTRRFTGPDGPTTPEQREQAEQNLKCYETELAVMP